MTACALACVPEPPPRAPQTPVAPPAAEPATSQPVTAVTPASPERQDAPAQPVVIVPAPPPAFVGPVVGAGALAIDAHYGTRGRVEFRRERGEHELKQVVAVGDSIVAVGYAQFGGTLDACVARFDGSGRLDRSFGQGGITRVGAQRAFGTQVAVDARGRLWVAGYFYSPGQSENLLLARLSADGVLDPSFGTGGLVAFDLGRADDRPSGVLPLPEGGVLVVGIHSLGGGGAGDYGLYVLRFDERGRIDTSFGSGGVRTSDPFPGREFGTRALLDRDGSVVVGGYRVRPDRGGFVARLKPSGVLDPRFGDGGVVLVRGLDSVWALAIDAGGRILLGGQRTDQRAQVVRLLADGRPDPQWRDGTGPAAGDDQLYALVPGADGTVVGAGFRGLADRAQPLVLRWSDAGALDTSIGSGGAVLGTRGDLVMHATTDARGGLVGVGMAVRGSDIVGLVTRFSAP